MKDDEFTKLFKYLQDEFKKIEQRFDDQKVQTDAMANGVDAYAKRADDYMQEMLMLSHKVDRLERWITKIAEKTGVQLTY